MRILIVGANGATGSAAAARALDEGHEVVQLVRREVAVTDPRGQRIVGDPLDTGVLAAAGAECDAIISALGVRSLGRTDLVSRGVHAIIAAAASGAPRRVAGVSAFGASDTLPRASGGARLLFRTLMRNIYADKAIADAALASSELDWTILYPGVLSNRAAVPFDVRPVRDIARVPGLPKSTRASVAQTLVSAVADGTWSRTRVVVTDR